MQILRNQQVSRASDRSGMALISVLAFVLITSIFVGTLAIFSVSHRGRVQNEADYAKTLDVAEAGLNYELQKVSVDSTQADAAPGKQININDTNGKVVGACVVYCQNTDGTSPWDPNLATNGGKVKVVSSGAFNGLSRIVQSQASGGSGSMIVAFPMLMTHDPQLILTSEPSPKPSVRRLWQIHNNRNGCVPVTVTWKTGAGTQSGTITVPFGVDYYFWVLNLSGNKDVSLYDTTGSLLLTVPDLGLIGPVPAGVGSSGYSFVSGWMEPNLETHNVR